MIGQILLGIDIHERAQTKALCCSINTQLSLTTDHNHYIDAVRNNGHTGMEVGQQMVKARVYTACILTGELTGTSVESVAATHWCFKSN
jgi:hypothetical protein